MEIHADKPIVFIDDDPIVRLMAQRAFDASRANQPSFSEMFDLPAYPVLVSRAAAAG